jgi:hypothetical protein
MNFFCPRIIVLIFQPNIFKDVGMQQLPSVSNACLFLVFQGGLELKGKYLCWWPVVDWTLPTQLCSSMLCIPKNHKVPMQSKYQLLQICKWNFCSMLLRLLGTISCGSLEHHMHWFCLDDLSHYVSGTMQKYVVVRPLVPIVSSPSKKVLI